MPQYVILEAIFRIRENVFQSFRTKVLSLLYTMRSLAYKISHCLSANRNPELRCVICTGVTLFAPVLHLDYTCLSQSESSNFFKRIIRTLTGITNNHLSLPLSGDFIAASVSEVSSWGLLSSCASAEAKAPRASACRPRHCSATPWR